MITCRDADHYIFLYKDEIIKFFKVKFLNDGVCEIINNNSALTFQLNIEIDGLVKQQLENDILYYNNCNVKCRK